MDFSQCSCSGKSLARLVRPAIMAVLARQAVHGYEIARRLAEMAMFDGQPPDPTGIYRALHSMEQEGLVASTWDLADSGPAKRRFELTPEGRKCLARWRRTLEDYAEAIAELLTAIKAAPRARRARAD